MSSLDSMVVSGYDKRVAELVRAIGTIPVLDPIQDGWCGLVEPRVLEQRQSLETMYETCALAAFSYLERGFGFMGVSGQNPSYLVLGHSGNSLAVPSTKSTDEFMKIIFNLVALESGADYDNSRDFSGRLVRHGDLIGAHLSLKAYPTPQQFLDLAARISGREGIRFHGIFYVDLYGINGLRYRAQQ